MSQSPTLSEVLREAIRADRLELHTAIPGVIETWDAATGLADIRVGVQTYRPVEDGGMEPRAHAVLPSVPVAFPGGGKFRASFPLAKGDPVEVVFQEASIDLWLEKGGGDVDPLDRRRHNISDPIAYPGARPKGQRWTTMAQDAATFGCDTGPQTVYRENVIELGGDAAHPPTDALALASLVKAEINALRQTVADACQTFASHTHVVATTGTAAAQTGTAAPPIAPMVPPAPVGEVKSTIIKAK